jgi:hypothetical protein
VLAVLRPCSLVGITTRGLSKLNTLPTRVWTAGRTVDASAEVRRADSLPSVDGRERLLFAEGAG